MHAFLKKCCAKLGGLLELDDLQRRFFLHTRKEMGEYVLTKKLHIYANYVWEKNTRFYVNVRKFLTNFQTRIFTF